MMFSTKMINNLLILGFLALLLNSCGMGADARKYPPNPDERVRKNIEEGRGFRLMDTLNKNKGSGNYQFASSNELWRASLDIVDFIPLASVNYSGGIIITDWYSNDQYENESIKISIRFLTNEIRSDALDIKVFRRLCDTNNKCRTTISSGELSKELKKKILKRAKTYEVKKKDKNFKPYETPKISK